MLTLNFINVIYVCFSTIILSVFGVFGVALIVLSIYLPIKDRKFRKNGVPIKATVKAVKEDSYTNEDNQTIRKGYNVTFEFSYNGKIKQKTIWSRKKFKVNSIKNGIYFEDDKKSILSIDGQGFYVEKGISLFLAPFGIFILFLIGYGIFEFSLKTLLTGIITYIIILVVSIFVQSKNKKYISNETNIVDKTYYENTNNNEYSTVSETLVRYIPKPKYKNIKKKVNKKFSIFNYLLPLIFAFLGILLFIHGSISTFFVLKIRFTYPSTTAEIINMYKYTIETSDGIEEKLGIIYQYTVNEKEYTFDQKSGNSFKFSEFKKIGDKEKLYYAKNNPEDAIAKSDFSYAIIPFVIGTTFIYLGIHFYLDDKRKEKLYKTYLLKGEE